LKLKLTLKNKNKKQRIFQFKTQVGLKIVSLAFIFLNFFFIYHPFLLPLFLSSTSFISVPYFQNKKLEWIKVKEYSILIVFLSNMLLNGLFPRSFSFFLFFFSFQKKNLPFSN